MLSSSIKMKRVFFVVALMASVAMARSIALVSDGASTTTDDGGWAPLFNGRNLDGWYTFLPSTGKDKEPRRVFKVEGGMIHVLDVPQVADKQEFGYLATEREFSHCRVRVEFKWGIKRFPPREEDKRDSGLLYYCVGPDRIWPRALECQIQETDVGDLWILDGATITTNVESDGFPMYSLPRSVARTQSRGRIIKSGDFEDRNGWNTVEVILDGDRVTHLVNGRVVMRAWDVQQPDPRDASKKTALDRGRIILQAEGAEIWFRNVQMKPLR